MDELRTEFVCHKPRHAAATAELARVVVAGGQHAHAYCERDIFEFWPVELFDCGVEGVAVDMNDCLG